MKSTLTLAQYKFLSEMIWGSVPVDRDWAEETSIFKEKHPRFIEINKDELVKVLKETNSLRKTATLFNVSVGCIRGKIKLFKIKR